MASGGRLKISITSRWQLLCGMLLVVVGFCMPLVINEQKLGVTYYFRQALQEERLMLLLSALLLVFMNILRAIPHYIGVYWIVDSFSFRYKGKRIFYVDAVLVILLLLLTYRLIDSWIGIHYDFGLPAIIMTGIIILYDLLDYNYVSLSKRTLFVCVTLMALQFLDIMPAAKVLPVGRGELSRDIKMAAEVLELERALNILAMLCLIALLFVAVVLFVLLRDENKLREMSSLREVNEQVRMEAHASEVQNRMLKEMQYLVHDLKSPLSVVQTLEGVLRMKEELAGDDSDMETFDRMEKALDQMSLRISQLLTADQKDSFPAAELFDNVMAQISIESFAPYVSAAPAGQELMIYGNELLLSRALVNLVQNAVQAVPKERTPRVILSAEARDGWAVLKVADNGRGVSPEQQKLIWNHGYSGKESSGLGLAFVQLSVERSGGHVELESDRRGTTISLVIPQEETDGE